MPPKNLGKITKHINKKKGKNAVLHNASRDSKRLVAAGNRDDKLMKLATVSRRSHRPYVNRVLYFQQALEQRGEAPITVDDIRTHVESWINRNADELAQLKAARRPGRPTSKREDDVSQVKAHDEIEYASGYWIPNLQDPATLLALRNYNGDWVSLATMKFQRFHKDGALVESSFPPKGES